MSLTALALAGVLAAPQEPSRALLPGYADIPAVAGDPDCRIEPDDGAEADCVTVSLENQDSVFYEYVGLLRRSGWRFTGGAAVVFYFQRDRADGGCEGIDLAALADFERLDRPREMRIPPMIALFKRPDVECVTEAS